MKKNHIFLVGIDEVGRGPLAGPVVVACILSRREYLEEEMFKGIKDSKKLTAKKRVEWNSKIEALENEGKLISSIFEVSCGDIDKYGIVPCITRAAKESLSFFGKNPGEIYVLSDYGIKIPDEYAHENIIKGDEKEELISAASIKAKVYRDTLMESYDSEFPAYGFSRNKGYGTKEHRDAILENGPIELHRKTFIKSLYC